MPGNNVVKRFVDGFVAERKPNKADALPSFEGATGTPDDLLDYASVDTIEASTQEAEGTGTVESEPLRTISGLLDFMGGVGEEVAEWIERENGEGHRVEPPKSNGLTLLIAEIGTDSWKGTRFSIDKEEQIVRRNKTRRFVRLVNLGPEVVTVSLSTGAGMGVQPNRVSIPISKLDGTAPYLPVEIPTQEEVWATPATVGVASVLEVYDFFGVPDAD